MSNRSRRMGVIVGMAAAPLTALLFSPIASADPDVTTLGPYDIDGYDATLSYDTTDALDSYVTGTYDGTGFDLDAYAGAPGSDSYEVVLTDPGYFQLGFDDVDGSITYIDNFLGLDFIPTDPGLGLL